MIKTIEWTSDGIVMIDQTKLPADEVYITCRNYQETADAIRNMVIRGAPAIGVAAAMGVARGICDQVDQVADPIEPLEQLDRSMELICTTLAATRPTAINLFWALERMKNLYVSLRSEDDSREVIRDRLVEEAQAIHREDIEINKAIGKCGATLLPANATVMTHCNAGALATAGYGTALGVIRAAVEGGNSVVVLANETRPFMQGARLTVWELQKDKIPVTLLTDNMAGHVLRSGQVGAVVVGADRIASNGDVANKIGTYSVAVLAKENNIPFYVAAPISTLDMDLVSGDEIPIEQRDTTEVTQICGQPIAPPDTTVLNPAFDVTPNRYISAIITERGVARAPYTESLRQIMS
ncbi:MAG: S-methyl-5-thioribose-1-phosphate isomerase [Solibacterales bacterium]|nr:S-methyl-5-thioribose-1-phosphate isomerase [Bryobacterales bacterium]|tara:strand:+ start:2789 stop:3847 length:1059 start_codon:yes stop_codon:yes gene_type:complete